MSQNLDYTTVARRFASKFPLLTRIATHVNFWIMANLLLAVILHLQKQALGQSDGIAVANEVLFGLLYGTCLGTIDFYFEKSRISKIALGKVMLIRTRVFLRNIELASDAYSIQSLPLCSLRL